MATLRRFFSGLVRFLPGGILVLSFILTFSLYGSALSFGFAFDDPYDLPRAVGQNPWTLLSSSADHAYYRPLPFLLWKALVWGRGGFDPVALHLVNLLAHAFNGWLVYLLGSRLAGRGFGALSWLLFLFFPLSFQAVPNINAVFHPLVTLFVLGALFLYEEFRSQGRAWRLVASLTLAVIGLFTHEYGVAVAPLALGLELYLWRRRPETAEGQRPRFHLSWWPGLYFGAAAVFLLIWMAVPKWGGPLAMARDSWAQNGLFLSQGLTWPLTLQLGGLPEFAEEGMEPKLGGVIAATVIALGGLYWWRGQWPLFALALSWFVVSVGLAWAVLPFSYLIDGNRLLYLASVGISWLWAGLWLLGPGVGKGRWMWRGGLLIMGSVLLAESGQFIQQRHQMYAQGTELTRTLAQSTVGQGDFLLVVNFPSWFAPQQAEFPYGHSGVTVVPNYFGLGRAIYLERGDEPAVASLGYEDILYPQGFHFGLHGLAVGLDTIAEAARRAEAVFMVEYREDGMYLEKAGRWRSSGNDDGYLADFTGQFRLAAAQVAFPKGRLRLGLRWEIVGSDGADYTIFAHLYDEAGRLVAQTDGYPLRGLFPLRLARSGEALEEWRDIPLGTGLPPGRYQVAVGIYDRQNGHRLPAQDPSGHPWPNGAVTIAQVSLP